MIVKPLRVLISFHRHKSFPLGQALMPGNAVWLAVGISVEFPKVLDRVKGEGFVHASQLCPHSISLQFFHVGPAQNSCQGVQRKKLSVAENNPRIKGRTGQQVSRKNLWPIIYLWGKHIWCWFFKNWQAICSKALQKANIISSLLRLFQVGSKWGRSLLSFSFWVISFFHVLLPCLLSAPWLSITTDYSLRPDFHPPVCVCLFVSVLFFVLCVCKLNFFIIWLSIASSLFAHESVLSMCVCPSLDFTCVCVCIYIHCALKALSLTSE